MAVTDRRWWRLSCSYCDNTVARWHGEKGGGPSHQCLGFVKPFDCYEPTKRPGTGDRPINYLRGDEHPQAKLTTEKVIEIRDRYRTDPSATVKALAREFDVSRRTIARVISGLDWKQVAAVEGEDTPVEIVSVVLRDGRTLPLSLVTVARLDIRPQTRLNPDIVRQIRREHAEGTSYHELGQRLGVSYAAVRNAGAGKTWRDVEDQGERRMIVDTITQLPTFADLDVWAGDSVIFDVSVTIEGTGAVLDVADLAASMDDGTDFDLAVTGNVVTLSLAEGVTKQGNYDWDLQWDTGQGRMTLVAGRMRVRGEVTT